MKLKESDREALKVVFNKCNVQIGKYYYAITPRSKEHGKKERVKVIDIFGDIATVIPVDNLIKAEKTYDVNLIDISSWYANTNA